HRHGRSRRGARRRRTTEGIRPRRDTVRPTRCLSRHEAGAGPDPARLRPSVQCSSPCSCPATLPCMRTAVVRIGVDLTGELTADELTAGTAELSRLAAEVGAELIDNNLAALPP